MNINTISVKQLRENFGELKSGLEEGLTYLLIYRSRPLAEIKPLINMPPDVRQTDKKKIKSKLRQAEKILKKFNEGRSHDRNPEVIMSQFVIQDRLSH